ncbi:MAG: hypothetical protein LBG64_02055, partial [Pseudomonadales bacterium]|nr:hypothetical protein [Pseudomonadales bacterium]
LFQKSLLIAGVSILVIFSLLLTTRRTVAIWDALPFMAFAQFSWRYLSVALVLLGFLSGALVWLTSKKIWQIVLMWLVSILLIVTNVIYFQPDPAHEDIEGAFYVECPQFIRDKMSSVMVDYMPINFKNEWVGVPIEQFLLVPTDATTSSEVNLIVNRAHQRAIATNFLEPTEIEWSVVYYPGWVAEIDGEPAEIFLSENGNISMVVPEGERLVSIRLTNTPVRLISNLVSLVGLIVLLYIWIYPQVNKKWQK